MSHGLLGAHNSFMAPNVAAGIATMYFSNMAEVPPQVPKAILFILCLNSALFSPFPLHLTPALAASTFAQAQWQHPCGTEPVKA